jgi:hypothetical protein
MVSSSGKLTTSGDYVRFKACPEEWMPGGASIWCSGYPQGWICGGVHTSSTFFPAGFGVGLRFFWSSCLENGGGCGQGPLQFSCSRVSLRWRFPSIGVSVSSGVDAPAILLNTACPSSCPSSLARIRSALCSPTDPRLKDHLRCLASEADRTGRQPLCVERSGTETQAVTATFYFLDHECSVSVDLCRTFKYLDLLFYERPY